MQRLWPLTCPPLKRLRKWQEALLLSPPCVCVCVFVMSHVCDDLKPPGTQPYTNEHAKLFLNSLKSW